MRRVASRARRRVADDPAEGERPAGHPILELQAAAGNQAVAALLLRQPVKDAKATEHEERARTLAKQLDKDRAAVIDAVRKLGEDDRKALHEAAAKVLGKAQAALLRRVIAFVRNTPSAEKNDTPVTSIKPGKEEFVEDVEGGKITAQSGVKFYGADGNPYPDAFSLSYSGSGADTVHWLQFIWREFVAEFPAKKGGKARKEAIKGKWKRPTSEYELTTDPAKPNWNVDVVRADSPFYEHNQPLNRSPTAVTMFDAASPGHDVVEPEFKRDEPPKKVVSQAHFTTYLVRGMDIVHATQVDLRWEFEDAKIPPMKPPVVKASGARKLEPAQRARLREQFPSNSLEYLP